MALPAKLQANILSWVEDGSAAPSKPVSTEEDDVYNASNLLTPADLFSLSSLGLAAGSPGVVVKDGFLGREQAVRAYEGDSVLHSAVFQIERETRRILGISSLVPTPSCGHATLSLATSPIHELPYMVAVGDYSSGGKLLCFPGH